MFLVVVIAVAWLAFANGANDNFKGVATLYGSGTLSYRAALAWATLTTFGGSMVSIALAGTLLSAFSGSGLLPPEVAGSAAFQFSAVAAAAITILLATRFGMPTSTTHALTGALLGVALVVDGGASAWAPLTQRFAVPLLVSPLVAIVVSVCLFLATSKLRRRSAPSDPSCICVVAAPCAAVPATAAAMSIPSPALVVGSVAECERSLGPNTAIVRSDRFADAVHVLSAGSVCFARALNDTPKIAALLFAAGALGATWSLALVALAMALGGLVASRRVAETMSRGITTLDPVEGLSANLTTAGLVIAASRYGLPVSTTHVSCGSIFGIGAVTRSARWATIAKIFAAWAMTLPIGALLAALFYSLARPLL
jgi:inorganic phosphate transporter, PiT family